MKRTKRELKKKMLSLLLCASMVLSGIPVSAEGETELHETHTAHLTEMASAEYDAGSDGDAAEIIQEETPNETVQEPVTEAVTESVIESVETEPVQEATEEPSIEQTGSSVGSEDAAETEQAAESETIAESEVPIETELQDELLSEEEQMTERSAEKMIEAVRALIAALPELDELEKMSEAERQLVYDLAQEAWDAWEALTEEEQDALEAELIKLRNVLEYMNSQTANVAGSISYVDYTWNEETQVLTSATKSVTEYTEVTEATTAMSDGWYVVTGEVTISERITVTGEVHLILADGAHLTVNNGICVNDGNSLYIYAQSSDESTMGRLTATGSIPNCAVIGSQMQKSAGTLVFNGGIVNANGIESAYGATIGSGYYGGNGGNITINAGVVTATSRNNGAAIGSGESGVNGGNITINGGTVTATVSSGLSGGSAIGAGYRGGNGGNILITGGTVTATSSGGAGIGVAYGGKTASITILGGTVSASGRSTYGNIAKGNGSSMLLDGTTITVSGAHTLPVTYTVPEGITLNIPNGASLTVPEGVTLTNNGTINIAEGGTLTINGDLVQNGDLTNDGTFTCKEHSYEKGTCTGKGEGCTYLGSPTCKTLAACSICHKTFGEVDPSNHELTEVYYEYADDDVHYVYHKCCGALKETAAHTESINATCTGLAHCDVCGSDYGTTNGNVHSSQDTYCEYIDAETHGVYYSCCGGLKEKVSHTESRSANCLTAAHCDVCDSDYGTVDGNNHAGMTLTCVPCEEYGKYNKHQWVWECCSAVEREEEHTWTYSVRDDTDEIIQTCDKCNKTGRVIFYAENKVYDGTKVPVTVEKTGLFGEYHYSSDVKISYCCGENGCIKAGKHTITMTVGDHSVSKEVTIEPKEVTLKVFGAYKEFDGTDTVEIGRTSVEGVIAGDEVYVDEDILKVFTSEIYVSDYDMGYASDIRLIGEDADNYYIGVNEEGATSVELQSEYGDSFHIYQSLIYITPLDQQLAEGVELDQSKYTLQGLDEKFTISGIALHEEDGYIYVRTDNIKVFLGGEDVTVNFTFSANQMGNILRMCEGHTFNAEGFCSTGNCNLYQPAEKNDNGTSEDPYDDFYEIRNAGQLYWFAQQVNDYGKSDINGKLMSDITVNADPFAAGARTWIPIGSSSSYYGEFDGNGKTVSGLYCNAQNSYVGFFGSLGYYSVTDLHIANSYFEGDYAGGIAGYSGGAEITNCSVAATVTIKGNNAGGLVGNAGYGSIKNCFSLAAVTESGTWGGLAGSNYADIENCFTNGKQPVGGGRGSFSNVYYGKDTRDYETPDEDGYVTIKPTFDGATEVTDEEDFKSGKIAYLLQQGVKGEFLENNDNGEPIYGPAPQIWYQTIGVQDYPSFSGAPVYQYTNCEGTDKYANEKKENGTHVLDTNGFCSICKGYQRCEGEGTAESPYLIANAGNLYWFAQQVNSGKYGIHAKLTANIKVNEKVLADGGLNSDTSGFRTWIPIGQNNENSYYGTFDGADFTISGLYCSDSTVNYAGLFGCVGKESDNRGTVKRVTIADSYFCGNSYVGGIVGYNNDGVVKRCWNSVNISGDAEYVGGICGYNKGQIMTCYNTGNVTGKSEYVGGLIGKNEGSITDSFNIGSVKGNCYVGGIVGADSTNGCENCYYLENCAADSTSTVQNGIGKETCGSTTADENGKTQSMNSDQFSSGEVAYYLNRSNSELSDSNPVDWKQKLGQNGDQYPNFTSDNIVYYGYLSCEEGAAMEYTNEKASSEKPHKCDENGFCTICGAYQRCEGEGTAESPYLIKNAGNLYWFAEKVNNGEASIHGKLTANITVNKDVLVNGSLNSNAGNFRTWTPIGTGKLYKIVFKGTFDGDGHTVSGLYYSGDNSYVGLFGMTYDDAVIQNVGIVDSYFKSSGVYVGGVVGYANKDWNGNAVTTISGCYNTGYVENAASYSYVGGVVGYIGAGKVENCYNSGTVVGVSAAGGVIGSGSGSGNNGNITVTYCYNTGNVAGEAAGGIAGRVNANANGNRLTLSNCYNTGAVSGSQDAGGVVSSNDSGSILNCYNTGSITGTENAGGVVAHNDSGTISSCYHMGTLSGGSLSDVYGVVAYNYRGTVKNCYYLDTKESDYVSGTTYETDADFKSGKVTWLLNEGVTDGTQAWYQTCGEGYPVFSGATVYGGYTSCVDVKVSNDSVPEGVSATPIAHAEYENGFCKKCGAYQSCKGEGTAENPYLIGNAGNLYWFAQQFNNDDETICGKMTADITVNSNVLVNGNLSANADTFREWIPIGNEDDKYKGTFDGNGKYISGLYFNKSNVDYVGLFGYVDEGTVKNVTIKDSWFQGYYAVGGVVGYAESSEVTGCTNAAIVNGNSNVGGVVGSTDESMVEDCHNSGIVNGISYDDDESRRIGGVVGYNQSDTVSGCSNTGTVTGGEYVGGVSGDNDGTVKDCYNASTVSGRESVGGVSGNNSGTMIKNYNSGAVSGEEYVGGVSGDNNDNVTNCYNNGAVSGKEYVGGVSGNNDDTVTNCYNSGTVKGDSYTGGVVGYNDDSVINCYYLTGCASDGRAIQNGIGNEVCGSTTADEEEKTRGCDEATFKSGKITWLLNGQTDAGDSLVWKQTLTTDTRPNFTGKIVHYNENANPQYYNEISQEIASVGIVWTDMSFSYNKGSWNTESMTWEGGGWAAEDDCGTVTVTNTGDVAVNAQFNVNFTDNSLGISVSFTENDVLLNEKKLKILAGEAKTVKVKLTGNEPSQYIEEAMTIGQITITLSTE